MSPQDFVEGLFQRPDLRPGNNRVGRVGILRGVGRGGFARVTLAVPFEIVFCGIPQVFIHESEQMAELMGRERVGDRRRVHTRAFPKARPIIDVGNIVRYLVNPGHHPLARTQPL